MAGGVLEKRPEKCAQMLDIAIGNTDRLVRLVNDILDLERIGSGTPALHREKANAATCCAAPPTCSTPPPQATTSRFASTPAGGRQGRRRTASCRRSPT